MISWFARDASFLWSCIWQSSMLLMLGLVASYFLSRRPARAHAVLCLAIVAGLLSPLLTVMAGHAGLGIFERRIDAGATEAMPGVGPAHELTHVQQPDSAIGDEFATNNARQSNSDSPNRPSAATAEVAPPAGVISPSAAGVISENSRRSESSASPPPVARFVDWRDVALAGWACVSGLLLLRLAVSAHVARKLISSATIVAAGPAFRALAIACERLSLSHAPTLAVSPTARCPMVWCWSRRPVLLIPASWRTGRDSAEMVGVFCHELAHCARRDHWSHLLADLAACALPWQPLIWWSRGQLRQLSERACDDWALASGVPAVQYADTLVALIPQPGPATVLAAASSKAALFDRVTHILRGERSDPRLSRRWRTMAGVAAAGVVMAAALAQTRDAPSQNSELTTNSEQLDSKAPTNMPAAPPPAPPEKSLPAVWWMKTVRALVVPPCGSLCKNTQSH